MTSDLPFEYLTEMAVQINGFWQKNTLWGLLCLYVTAALTSMAAMEIAAWLLVVLTVVMARPRDWRIGLEWPLAALFGAVLLSELVNFSDVKTLFVTLGELRWIVVLYAITWCFRATDFCGRPGVRTLGWIAFTFLVVTVVAYDQFLTGRDRLRPHAQLHPVGSHFRAEGFFDICMTFAYAIGVATLYHAGRALEIWRTDRREAWLGFVIAALGSLCLYFSFTRGAWLAWGAAVSVGVLVWRPNVRVVLGLGVAGALLLGALLQTPAFRERLRSVTDTTQDQSNAQRLVLWEAELEIWREHPLFGVGWNKSKNYVLEAYQKIGRPESTFVSHAHNNTLQTLAGVGLVGLFANLWLFIAVIWLAWRRFRTSADPRVRACALGALMAQVFLHVGGLTECNFIDGEVNHNLMLTWAALLK